MLSSKIVGLFALMILTGINQVPQEALAQAQTKDADKGAVAAPQKKDADIKGFRSAHFGMTEKEVLQAIMKDFKIAENGVKKESNALEKTRSLAVGVNNLLPDVGAGRVVYILGYKSKKLIQVNVLWGLPITQNPDAENLVNIANLLRNHFLKKEYKKGSVAANLRLQDGSVLVFRGTDKKDRMALLLLTNPPVPEEEKDKQTPKLSLRLSYIGDPASPDIYKVEEDAF